MVGKASVAFALLNAIDGVSAFWRMECRGRTGLARIDPLVDPGRPSTHVHALHGSSALSPSSTNADLRAGNCTSCAVKQDMSAYWHPALYFQDSSTGEFELAPQVGGLLAYYLLRNPEDNDKVTAFPEGFNMLAGTTHRRSYTVGDVRKPDPPTSDWVALGQTTQEVMEQRAIGFNCLNYKKGGEDALFRHYLPEKSFLDANCPDGIRLEVMFPSCWDGKNLDSVDHKSHMAYPDLLQNGACPKGFPVRLPTLFYEVIWSTKSELFEGRSGEFVVSNGDPTGFGYHADFMSGWDVDFLQDAVDRCTNESGRLTDCPVFMEAGPLQTEYEMNQCFLEEPDVDLNVEVELGIKLAALPGNVPILGSGAAAPPDSPPETGFFDHFTSFFGIGPDKEEPTTTSPPPAPPAPTTTSTSPTPDIPTPEIPSDPIAPSIPSVPGGAFLESSSSPTPTPTTENNVAALTAEPTPETTPPPPPPPEPTTSSVSSDPGVLYEVVSTEILTEGNKVKEVVWKEPIVYVTEDVVTTTTVAAAAPPVKRSESPVKARREHWLRHQQRHGRRV